MNTFHRMAILKPTIPFHFGSGANQNQRVLRGSVQREDDIGFAAWRFGQVDIRDKHPKQGDSQWHTCGTDRGLGG